MQTITTKQARKMIGEDNSFWQARCKTYDEADFNHIVAWAFVFRDEGAPEEGVEIEPGTVVISRDGVEYRVTDCA